MDIIGSWITKSNCAEIKIAGKQIKTLKCFVYAFHWTEALVRYPFLCYFHGWTSNILKVKPVDLSCHINFDYSLVKLDQIGSEKLSHDDDVLSIWAIPCSKTNS